MTFFWILSVALILVLFLGVYLLVAGTGNRKSTLVRQADQHLDEGRLEDAEPLLRQALEVDPDQPRARWELAKLLQRSGRYADASDHLEYCLNHSLYPEEVNTNDALVRLAQIYEKGKLFEEAIDTWSRYIEQNSNSMEAHFRRGRLYFRENRIDRAIEDFRSIEENFEDSPDLLSLYLGRCLYRKEQFDQAYNYYVEYLSSNTDNMDAQVELASLARTVGQEQEARELYESILQEGSLSQEAEARLSMSSMAREKGEIEEAEEHLNELEELREVRGLPENLDLHCQYQKAKLLEARHENETALDIYRSLYEKRKNFLDVESIIDERIDQLDPEDLLDNYMNVNRATFSRMAEEIVELMGFEPMSTDSFGPDEVHVSAREEVSKPSVNRVLFTFKRWENNVGEWPLREFELQILEKRFDRGILVAPGGFQYSAKQYVERSPIRLIGPDTLLQYLKEVEKKEL
jgi:tetratricopeptide (TPR) repeat protein